MEWQNLRPAVTPRHTWRDLAAGALAWCHPVPARGRFAPPRLLVIRRNAMGDMLLSFPLLQALRRRFPQAHLAVATEAAGAAVAPACAAVDRVHVLDRSRPPALGPWRAAARLQGFDLVVAVKGGFDQRLATLARLTNAPVRIGFDSPAQTGAAFYTHPVAWPATAPEEHQIEAVLRLLAPWGEPIAPVLPDDLRLTLPPEIERATELGLAATPLGRAESFGLLNLSSNRPVPLRPGAEAELLRRLLTETPLAFGLTGVPRDYAQRVALARLVSAARVVPLVTPTPLHLAALLRRARCFLTPEGGAGHLAAAVEAPAVILWTGPLGKWRPRNARQTILQVAPGESWIEVEPIVAAMKQQAAEVA